MSRLQTNDTMGDGNFWEILKLETCDLRLEDSVVNIVHGLAHCTVAHKNDLLVLSRCP